MNPAKEHLDKYLQKREDRKRRKEDVRFQHLNFAIAVYTAVATTIAVIVSVIALLK